MTEKVAGAKNLSNAIFKNLLGQLNAFTHIPVISFNIANSIKGLKIIKNRKQLLLLMRTGFHCLKTNHNDIIQPCSLTTHGDLVLSSTSSCTMLKLLDSLIVEY